MRYDSAVWTIWPGGTPPPPPAGPIWLQALQGTFPMVGVSGGWVFESNAGIGSYSMDVFYPGGFGPLIGTVPTIDPLGRLVFDCNGFHPFPPIGPVSLHVVVTVVMRKCTCLLRNLLLEGMGPPTFEYIPWPLLETPYPGANTSVSSYWPAEYTDGAPRPKWKPYVPGVSGFFAELAPGGQLTYYGTDTLPF